MSPIKHLSPSSLCLYRSSPTIWVLKYLLGAKDEAGPPAWRGSAVEAGLDAHFARHSAPLEAAETRFELDAQGEASDDIQKQRELIPAFLGQTVMACMGADVPTKSQHKIELRLDGIEWPILGYVDYLYPDWLFDLKTTERLPSAPKPDHVIQCAIYSEATGRPAKLLYVTPRKSAWYEITPEMQAEGLAEAHRLAGNIAALLALSDDPRKLLRALPVDPDNFRWNDNLQQQLVAQLA
jgi:PD-(D/E)XK nuclease superfamily